MEKILCAAIYYPQENTPVHNVNNLEKGIVLCGHRHHNIIGQYSTLAKNSTSKVMHIQGFLTSKNRFVDREEAMNIAYKANQVDIKKFENNKELYSEDLY